ncbi:glycosyl transferase [Croceivirga lutea]|uniref:glycosyltransferase n=1 Tax=Croceivirga lutea TaxID=1775167 RepID=UPI001639E196|nr:glycosyltransferase [Croceivirga lutea]GGG42459.1 glycosyl transferase [Croceivirga lutea]
MPKLVQINVVASFGSTGKIVSNIGQKAISNDWKSIIGYGQKQNNSTSDALLVGSKIDFYNHIIQTRLFDRHGLASKKATRNFIHSLKKINPDIIHLHNIHGYFLNYPTLFNYLSEFNKPIVWTLHDCWAFTGHCTHYENIGCYKWKTQCEKCPQLETYPASSWLDNSKNNFQLKKKYFTMPKNMHIITVSNWLKKEVKQSFLSNYEIETIYNGLDTQLFKPTENNELRVKFNLSNSKIILGVASVWSKNKGLLDFINLSHELNEDEKIVLIGLNKTQIQNLPSNIIGLERTQNVDELINWYSTADVYVNTSVEESFGFTTVEALACNTPVIVYNSTANPEIINDDVGLCIDKNNILQLRESISKILNTPKESYKRVCRSHVLRNFDNKDKIQEYMNLYESLI